MTFRGKIPPITMSLGLKSCTTVERSFVENQNENDGIILARAHRLIDRRNAGHKDGRKLERGLQMSTERRKVDDALRGGDFDDRSIGIDDPRHLDRYAGELIRRVEQLPDEVGSAGNRLGLRCTRRTCSVAPSMPTVAPTMPLVVRDNPIPAAARARTRSLSAGWPRPEGCATRSSAISPSVTQAPMVFDKSAGERARVFAICARLWLGRRMTSPRMSCSEYFRALSPYRVKRR